MRLYFDTAYIAKCYLREADGQRVRTLARKATGLYSSAWCLAEMSCVFQRHAREGSLSLDQAARLRELFLQDVRDGVWNLFPVSQRLLDLVSLAVAALPSEAYVRAGDALHLVSAREAGMDEVWSNDRRLLAAAGCFGVAGRSV